MPIYEYLCEKCEHEFEREQRITADPVKTCPKCRSRRVKQLISRTSFVLKGGGWYSDLYSSASGDDKKGKGDAKESGDSSTASSDSNKSGGDKASKPGKSKDKKKGKKAAA